MKKCSPWDLLRQYEVLIIVVIVVVVVVIIVVVLCVSENSEYSSSYYTPYVNYNVIVFVAYAR